MVGFVKGDVVVIPFPFSDLTTTKRRPALVLASLPGDDVILCQITSQPSGNAYGVTLAAQDFASGGLSRTSTIRPERLFTADSHIILRSVGKITDAKLTEVIGVIVGVLTT